MQRVPGADHRVLATGTGGAARQAVRLLAVGLLAGLLLGATPIRIWTESLTGATGAAMLAAAAQWEATTTRFGLDRPYAALRGLVRGAEGGR